jgi:hypothetical protein
VADLRHPVPADVADHIDFVRRKLERALGDEPELADLMRLAVLLHEEPPERVPVLLEHAGLVILSRAAAPFGSAPHCLHSKRPGTRMLAYSQ